MEVAVHGGKALYFRHHGKTLGVYREARQWAHRGQGLTGQPIHHGALAGLGGTQHGHLQGEGRGVLLQYLELFQEGRREVQRHQQWQNGLLPQGVLGDQGPIALPQQSQEVEHVETGRGGRSRGGNGPGMIQDGIADAGSIHRIKPDGS